MTDAPHKRPAFEPPTRLLKPTRFDPDMKRPISTVAGALLVYLRVLAGVLWIASVLLDWPNWLRQIDVTFDDAVTVPRFAEFSLTTILIVVGVFLLVDAALAFFILRGRNGARVIVMVFSVLSIVTSFIQWWAEGQEITIHNTLLGLGLDILILLALSSRSAAAYARRNERR